MYTTACYSRTYTHILQWLENRKYQLKGGSPVNLSLNVSKLEMLLAGRTIENKH